MILLSIAGGIWMLVFQNLGIIPVTQNVHVKSGEVDINRSAAEFIPNKLKIFWKIK